MRLRLVRVTIARLLFGLHLCDRYKGPSKAERLATDNTTGSVAEGRFTPQRWAHTHGTCYAPLIIPTVEDFRTTLKNATGMIKTLSSLNRQAAPGSAPSSPTAITSTLSSQPDESIPVSRTELISRLTTMLQTNIRMRYELNTNDLLQA